MVSPQTQSFMTASQARQSAACIQSAHSWARAVGGSTPLNGGVTKGRFPLRCQPTPSAVAEREKLDGASLALSRREWRHSCFHEASPERPALAVSNLPSPGLRQGRPAHGWAGFARAALSCHSPLRATAEALARRCNRPKSGVPRGRLWSGSKLLGFVTYQPPHF
jgi:hypothetical protein